MSDHGIDRADWKNFLDGFSRRHDGWLISVYVKEGSAPPRIIGRDMPLRGVVAELDDDTGSMMVFSGDAARHGAHFVMRPASIVVTETLENGEAALTIADESGVRTIVEFRSPMRTELVDGISSGMSR